MFADWLKLIRTIILIIGLLLSFFAIIEIIRAYQTLYDLHVWAGYGFLLVLMILIIFLILSFWFHFAKIPKSLKPPVIKPEHQNLPGSVKKRLKYLNQYLQKMLENPAINATKDDLIISAQNQIHQSLSQKNLKIMQSTIKKIEDQTISPLLQDLDNLALKQLRNSMRDIMLVVTLSPYKSADLLIVLYRNLDMSLKIIRIFNSRPSLGENIRIMIDIFNVVATVNYINVSKNLIENLAPRIPGIKHLVDDITQGIGAGFMTTIVGHAVIDRSRNFNPWDKVEAKRKILSKVGDFFKDVRDLFFSDIWQSFINRAGSVPAGIRDQIYDGIDKTGDKLKNIIITPISAVESATSSLVGALNNAGDKIFNKINKVIKPKKNNVG